MKKIIAIVMAALMMVGVLAGCKSNETPAASDLDSDYVKGKGKLVVGITDFAPMDYRDENGNWIGFDAELAAAFAEKLGVEVEFVEIEWDSKTMELDGKTIDCVWNGMTLTDDVLSAMECSKPYLNNQQIIVVPADKAAEYSTVEACKSLNFAVEAGSAGEEAAAANGFTNTPVDKQSTAVMEVASKTCDAAIIDSLMAAAMVGEGTSYDTLAYTIGLTDEQYGVGFRKGSDLAETLNKFLEDCKADGTLDQIAEKYKVQAALIK